MLEAPRLEAVRQLAEQAKTNASSAKEDRQAKSARREEIRREFAAAENSRIKLARATAPLMLSVGRARAAATQELCDEGAQATKEARYRF